MRLSRGNDTPRRRALSLTPLIDVVFLLLVFFMLASTFLKFGSVKVETAGAGNSTADISKVALIHIGAGGTVHIAGRQVESTRLFETFRALITQGRTHAVVVPRRSANVGDLVRGLTRVRSAGFARVQVAK